MNRRAIVLFVSLLLAGIAAFAVWQYLVTVEDNVRRDIAEVAVFRAIAPIPAGTEGSVAIGVIEPSTALAENIVFADSRILCSGPADRDAPDVDFAICDANPSDLQALLTGTLAAGPISVGQLITTDMFVTPAELDLDKLSADIPEGKVAIAISPGEVGAVGGFVRPGDRVNILATFTLSVGSLNELLANPATRDLVLANVDLSGLLGGAAQDPIVITDEETGETTVIQPPEDPLSQYASALPDTVRFTQTVLQDIDVIAFDTSTRTAPLGIETGAIEGDAVVVLEVTPAEAEVIEFVRQNAPLSLSLLPANAPYSEYATRGVTVDDIFGFVDRLREELEALGG